MGRRQPLAEIRELFSELKVKAQRDSLSRFGGLGTVAERGYQNSLLQARLDNSAMPKFPKDLISSSPLRMGYIGNKFSFIANAVLRDQLVNIYVGRLAGDLTEAQADAQVVQVLRPQLSGLAQNEMSNQNWVLLRRWLEELRRMGKQPEAGSNAGHAWLLISLWASQSGRNGYITNIEPEHFQMLPPTWVPELVEWARSQLNHLTGQPVLLMPSEQTVLQQRLINFVERLWEFDSLVTDANERDKLIEKICAGENVNDEIFRLVDLMTNYMVGYIFDENIEVYFSDFLASPERQHLLMLKENMLAYEKALTDVGDDLPEEDLANYRAAYDDCKSAIRKFIFSCVDPRQGSQSRMLAYQTLERDIGHAFGQPVKCGRVSYSPTSRQLARGLCMQRADRKFRYTGGRVGNFFRHIGNAIRGLFRAITFRPNVTRTAGLRVRVFDTASAARRASEQASPEAKAARRKRMAREREIRPHIGTIAR